MHKPERKSLKMIGNSDADRETGEQRCRQRDGGSDADRETGAAMQTERLSH